MRRSVLLGTMVIALCGCGVDVAKPTAPAPVPQVPEPAEIYDKVAPMPREVKPTKNDLDK